MQWMPQQLRHPCRHRAVIVVWFLLSFCRTASQSTSSGDAENEHCPCPGAGQSLGPWLGCIGVSTEQRERIEDQGWNAADLREMLPEEAMAALRVSREKAGRVMRCSKGKREGEREVERGEREAERGEREVERGDAGSRNLADLIVADDEATRSFCLNVMENLHSPWSQFNQDTFVWHNFLADRGNNGVYVDVGAYHPVDISNTAFFDLCLGWRGLCIEMHSATRPLFEKQRTCTFVNECVSDSEFVTTMDQGVDELAVHPYSASVLQRGKEEQMQIAKDMKGQAGPRSNSLSDPELLVPVRCRSLSAILREHGLRKVDLLSMDIEGQELKALGVFPFKDIEVDVIVVENDKAKAWALNFLMSVNGFRLEHQMMIDAVFARRGLQSPQTIQYPKGWIEDWERAVEDRCSETAQECDKMDSKFVASFAQRALAL